MKEFVVFIDSEAICWKVEDCDNYLIDDSAAAAATVLKC